jgi:solute:Na+ symporter, SSS family
MSNFLPFVHVRDILSHTDWIVFFITILVTFASVIYAHRLQYRKETENAEATILEYLLMGRQLTLPLFVATLVATWYGGIFGVTQIAFEHGFYNFLTQGIFWYISYIFFAVFLTKKILKFQALSLTDLIKKLYGEKSAKVSAILIFIKTLPIAYVTSLGLFIQILWPMDFSNASLMGVVLVIGYCMFGGLRAVVISDFVQFIFMYLGVFLVLAISYTTFGGMDFLTANLPSSHFTLCSTYSISDTLLWLMLACATTFINPAFYQRCLAAKSRKVAARGIIISTVFWIGFDICTTLGGMYAKAVIPEAESNLAYLYYSMQLLPSGLRGLLLGSVLSTILSTLDSFLFLASNVLFHDLNLIRVKNFKLKHILAFSITAFIAWWSAAFFSGNFEFIWKAIKGFFAACILFPLLIGYFLPNFLTDKQFVTVVIASAVTSIVWRIFFLSHVNIDPFYVGNITTILVVVIIKLFMLLYRNENRNYIFR